MKPNKIFPTLLLISICCAHNLTAQKPYKCNVIAYCVSDTALLKQFDVAPVTHLIFSFAHLKGNELSVFSQKDTASIEQMVALKKTHPALKVMVSLGGWTGCATCSAVFSEDSSREIFAKSVKHFLNYFKLDGIDLDWEYPAIQGLPGHRFESSDRENFTALVQTLRKVLGGKKEISFAAGGFQAYFDSSIEWKKVMPLVNRVNLMSYDLVSGYATTSGHHTPLYSTPEQQPSIDFGVKYLDKLGVPMSKIAIGAAFYGRIFQNAAPSSNGLYQPTAFKTGVSYRNIAEHYLRDSADFVYHWDSVAHAPYLYNSKENLLLTFDDSASIAEKTKYTIDKKLNGIMFWELIEDEPVNGLLHVIDEEIKKETKIN